MQLNEENRQFVLNTINKEQDKGIPTALVHIMEHDMIEAIAGTDQGDYVKAPHKVYLDMLKNIGVNFVDQFIPDNPLSMGAKGYDANSELGATTGAETIIRDGIVIDSPEAVVKHMERFVFPAMLKAKRDFCAEQQIKHVIDDHNAVQAELGPEILKTGYRYVRFPGIRYGMYGYANYFMAYALYPEIMEKDFSLQADNCRLVNQAAATAFESAQIPPLFRLDHDMADNRGTLVDIKSLDKIWFPHFARSLEPMLRTNVKMIWHSDGNLMEMYPRLLEVGIEGFQGFQYEAGMDYLKICRMKTNSGETPLIWAGSSVTTTLPYGTPEDVRNELKFLVENGPVNGLFLGATSSITPGVPLENLKTLIEGLAYYRTHLE